MQQTVKVKEKKGMMRKMMERRIELGGVQQLREEKSLKEMEGEEADQHFKSACVKKIHSA